MDILFSIFTAYESKSSHKNQSHSVGVLTSSRAQTRYLCKCLFHFVWIGID